MSYFCTEEVPLHFPALLFSRLKSSEKPFPSTAAGTPRWSRAFRFELAQMAQPNAQQAGGQAGC